MSETTLEKHQESIRAAVGARTKLIRDALAKTARDGDVFAALDEIDDLLLDLWLPPDSERCGHVISRDGREHRCVFAAEHENEHLALAHFAWTTEDGK